MSSGRRILESYMHSHVKERDRHDHVSQAVSRFGVLRVCVCVCVRIKRIPPEHNHRALYCCQWRLPKDRLSRNGRRKTTRGELIRNRNSAANKPYWPRVAGDKLYITHIATGECKPDELETFFYTHMLSKLNQVAIPGHST